MTEPNQGAGGGRYAVHAEIGAGGMATVHLGRLVGARGFSRTVAIKVLHASYARDKVFVERFLDEARIVGRIHHPNVMPTLDVIAEGDDLQIVMDYVAGESLDHLQAKVLEQGERIPVRVACAIIAGVLHGLHAAHESKNEFGEPLGIVHLDVSPQNILVGVDGTSRVLDFGVARARSSDQSSSPAGGKAAYLAPEQVRGAEVSPRTDVFAASVVLWELIAGEPLFAADNHAATMHRVLAGDIPLASEKAPHVPARIDELLKIGLKRDPGQRFATARDMALELEQAVMPALPSEVGSWVESVAHETLVARAAKVKEMEARAVSGPPAAATVGSRPPPPGRLAELVSARAMYDEHAAVNLSADDLVEEEGSLLRPPGGKDSVPQRAPDGSIRWKRKPAVAANVAPAKLAPRSKATEGDVPKTRRTLWVALGGSLVLILTAAIAARGLFLADYVKASAITAAAAHGVTLTVADASLSLDGVLLTGLTAHLAGVPQVSFTIASADVRSVWSSPVRVVLQKTEVAAEGDARALSGALTQWSLANRGRPRLEDEAVGGQIDLPSVHLVWTHPSGEDVLRVEAASLSGSIGGPSSASLGDELHFLTNALVIESRLGVFGPWSLSVDLSTKGRRARLAFDPAVPDGANALLVDDALGDSSFDVTIPRLNAAGLGVPRTALGPGIPFPQQVEVAIHYGRLNHEQTSATVRAAMYGLRIPELGTSLDAHLEGEATGPTGSPLVVKNGLAMLGPMRATVTGSLTPSQAGWKAALAWKGDPIPCASLLALPTPAAAVRDLSKKATEGDMGDLGQLARDFGALGEAAGVVKVTGTLSVSGTVTADSADPGHSKWSTTAKNPCGVTLFQGK